MYAPLYSARPLSANMAAAAVDIRTPFQMPGKEIEAENPFTRENDIFEPLVRDTNEDSPATRIKGLRAYVTSDMRPDRQKESDRIFGRTLPFQQSHESLMRVGRALASATGHLQTPATFFQDPRFKDSFKIPEAWADRNDLYAAIGNQFANKERSDFQHIITHEQTIFNERMKDPNALMQAIVNAATRKSISLEDRILLDHAEIPHASIRKVNAALNILKGESPTAIKADREAYNIEENAGNTDLSTIGGKTAPGLSRKNGWGAVRIETEQADRLADILADDKLARQIFLEFAAMAGRTRRQEMQGDDASDTAVKSIKESWSNLFDKTLARWILDNPLSEKWKNADIPDSENATLISDRRNAFRHALRQAYEAGYAQQDEAIMKDASWGTSIARLPVHAANLAAGTVGWLSRFPAALELADIYSKSVDEAADNIYKADPTNMEASWWERKGVPSAQAGISAAAIVGSGALLKGAASLTSSRFAPELAKRVAGSRWLSYGANFAEGVTSEVLEELIQTGGQESMELVGMVHDRQKKESLKQLKEAFTSAEWWAGNIGMNSVFAMTGYRGSRSKVPYHLTEKLTQLGLSKEKAASVTASVQDAIAAGESEKQIAARITKAVLDQQSATPERTEQGMMKTSLDTLRQRRLEDAAASGVRDIIIKEYGLSDMQRNADGTVTFKMLGKDAEGNPTMEEKSMTEQELNSWLLSSAAERITDEILTTQKLVRGEQLSQAAIYRKGKKSPFTRIAFLHDAPAEVLAALKGRETFDHRSIAIMGQYVMKEITRRMQAGETPEQAAAAPFGNTGLTLGQVYGTQRDFAQRVSIALKKKEIDSPNEAESAAFMVPGETLGDTVLFLARGEVNPSDIAHEWMEGFARARYESDPEAWQSRLDALDRELLSRGVISESIFTEPPGSRSDMQYIEALTDLSTRSWLSNHESFDLTPEAHDLLEDVVDDLGAIQGGLAFADELSAFLDSQEAKDSLGGSVDSIRDLLAEAGLQLTDLIKEAAASVPTSAAEFITAHRKRIAAQISGLADQIENPAPPPPAPPADAEIPESVVGVSGVTQKDVDSLNNINPETGTLIVAPPAATVSVTAPKGAGRSLVGGQAHKMPNRTIQGTARMQDISIPSNLADTDWEMLKDAALFDPDADGPIVLYRHKSGKLELIGNLTGYARVRALGQPVAHVSVYEVNDKHNRSWANDQSRIAKIKSGAASAAEIISYVQSHKLSRAQARKANLIPRDHNGKEYPSSRAAWLLLDNASKDTLSHLKSGTITTREALSSIADKVDTLDVEAEARRTSSFSIRRKSQRRYSGIDSLRNEQLYTSLQETVQQYNREFSSLLSSPGGKTPQKLIVAATRALAFRKAVFAVLPKEARPWLTLSDMDKELQALTEAAINPLQDLSNNTPGWTPAEVQRYNELVTQARRQDFIASRLASRTASLLKATARSMEAYLCREMIDTARKAFQVIMPKEQPSGKERRGLTDSTTFTKAKAFYDMMFWSDDKREKELNAIDQELMEADADAAVDLQVRRNAITLFGALESAGYTQTKLAVNQFLNFIDTGRAKWEEMLHQERRENRARQILIAKAHPKVDKALTDKLEADLSTLSQLGRTAQSYMNPVQLLDTLSEVPEIGPYFAQLRDDLSQSLDATTLQIQQAHLKADAALDAILGNEGKSRIVRDMARAKFIVASNQRKPTGIKRKGVMQYAKYKFTQAQVEELASLLENQMMDDFEELAMKALQKAGTEDEMLGAYPHEEAVRKALEHIQKDSYKGGDIYIELETARDTLHAAELELSPQQAANIVLMSDQPSYGNKYDEQGNMVERGVFDKQGFTDEVLDKLEAFAGPQLMEYFRWKRDFLNETGLFEAYEQYMGIPFPKEEDYWPGNFDSPTSVPNMDALTTTYIQGGTYQMTVKRRRHNSEPKLGISADEAWSHAIAQHYTYINLSPITRQLRNLLRDQETITRLDHIAGRTVRSNLQLAPNFLDGMPAVQLVAERDANRISSRWLASKASQVLTLATNTLLRNFTTIANFAINAKHSNLKNIGTMLPTMLGVGGPMTPASIQKLPSMQIRHNRESLTRRAQSLGENQKQTPLAYASVLGKFLIEKADFYGNAFSMATLYNNEYKAARQELHDQKGPNLTPEYDAAAHKLAERAVSTALHQFAQPLEVTDKPLNAQISTAARSAMAFMKSEVYVKLAGFTMSAKRELSKIPVGASPTQRAIGRYKAAKAFIKPLWATGLTTQSVNMIIAAYMGNAPDMDDEDYLEWLTINAIIALTGVGGYINAVPFIGEGINETIYQITGTKYFATFADTGLQFLTIQDLRNFANLTKENAGTGQKVYAAANASRYLGTLANFISHKSPAVSLTAEILTGINAAANFVRPFLARWKNEDSKKQKGKKKTSLDLKNRKPTKTTLLKKDK